MRDLTFGGGSASSVFSPIVLALILLAGILILTLPRNRAVFAFLLTAIVIPLDQVLVVGSLHFPMLRVLILFGLARVAMGKFSGKDAVYSGGLNGIDYATLALTVFTLIDGILLWGQWAQVVFQVGAILTSLGTYTVLRFLIRDENDIRETMKAWAWATALIAVIMIGEHVIGKNVLYMAIGGGRASVSINTMVRDGSLRARGAFLHPILAGTFGGFSLPLFLGLWWRSKEDRKYAAVGAVSSVIMAAATSSSTALMGMLGGIVALCFWPLRKNMRLVRWAIGILLVSLHIVMKAPVWELIARIDLTGGSSSWHRFMLLDQCIHHFTTWMLYGTTEYPNWGWEMWDLSNQYVLTAETAGLIPLIALMMTFVMAYKYIGRTREAVEGNKPQELFIWAIGASLVANMVAFNGISYFDQTVVGWYCLLAMICAVSLPVRVPALAGAPAMAAAKPEGRVEIRKPAAGPRGPLQPFPGKNVGPIPKYNPVRQKL